MHHFIVNPNSKSGKGIFIWNKIKNELDNTAFDYKVYFTTKEHNGKEIVKDIMVENEHVSITAIGGDGTVNEVVNGIDDFEKVTFSYIPTGSSNDFARGLSLHNSIKNVIDNIMNPKDYYHINIGEISSSDYSRYFVVSCGIGFDAQVCFEALDSPMKNKLNKLNLGKLSYVGIAIKKLISSKFFTVDLTRDNLDKKKYKKVFFMTVMNLPYQGGGFKLCPHAKYNDNLFDSCLIHNISKMLILILLPTAYKGKHTYFKGVELHKSSLIDIQTNSPVAVHTDGEYFGYKENISIRCLEKKLKVVKY